MKRKFTLVGVDGNAFSVMGYVSQAMEICGKNAQEIKAYENDAMSADYNHLIAVSVDMLETLNAMQDEA